MVVGSSGNENPDRAGQLCDLSQLAESPSMFVVGGAGLDATTSSNYDTIDRAFDSASGPIQVTVQGINRNYSQVDALAPGYWHYPADNSSGFDSWTWGTSEAAPQIAGAALLVKDWFLDNGYSINSQGRLHAAILAMTDRANSASTYRSTGFNSSWGGGRFQTRYYNGADHSGVWGWQSTWYSFSGAGVVDHLAFGAGVEPSTLNQFKVYAVFFEDDGGNAADITLQVRDSDCGSGSAVLGSDFGYDHKKMVRLSGGTAAGEALCVRLDANHIPFGETRRVQLFMYYSASTFMR
jgi:hypothetical protein